MKVLCRSVLFFFFALLGVVQNAPASVPSALKAKTDPLDQYSVVVPMLDTDPVTRVSGQLYYDVSTNTFKGIDNLGAIKIFANGASSQWVTSGTSISYAGGAVGVGTSSPVFPLDVAGAVNGTQLCIDGSCKSSWESVVGPSLGTLGTSEFTPNTLVLRDSHGAFKAGTIAAAPFMSNAMGSQSNPAFTFVSGSAKTGMFMPDPGTLGFTVSGFETFRVNAGGTVGIGTGTPGYKLDVAGSVNGTQLCIGGSCKSSWESVVGPSLGTLGTSSNTPNTLVLRDGQGSFQANTIQAGSIAASPFVATTKGSQSNPPFTFQGDMNTGVFMPGSGTLGITVSGTEVVRVDSAGRVGIGTSAPAAKLHIVQGATTSWGILATAGTNGIYGQTNSASGIAISGYNAATQTQGLLGYQNYGVYGYSSSGHGMFGNSSSGYGLYAVSSSNAGVYAWGGAYGVFATGASWGVWCQSASCGGVGGWYASSDRRLKENIKPLQGSLGKILGLKGVSYDWIDPDLRKSAGHQLGFVAQDMEPIFPEAVKTDHGPNSKFTDGTKTISYTTVLAPLVEAFKEFYGLWADDHLELKQLREEVKQLKTEIEAIKKSKGEAKALVN